MSASPPLPPGRRAFLGAGMAGMAAAMWAQTQPAPQPAPPPPPMKVLLWCWDARMTWDDEPGAIQTRMAAAEKRFVYPKRPEAFQTGFRRLIDFAAANGIWGVILWGFLRDSHGGIPAARDLCRYARDKGVAILPGVGLCSYGGYYYEGDHPFNLDTYLRTHPERASTAREEGGGRDVGPVLDPSLEANRRWWRDGLEWMLETFAIAGIDYEMGDFIVNPSPEAQAARVALGFQADANIQDMVVATREVIQRGLEMRPEGVFINALYRGPQSVTAFPKVPYAEAMPPQAVWEYTLTGAVRSPKFPDAYRGAPPHRQYGYLHWFNASTNTQDRDYVPEIARVFPGAQQLGYEFIGTYGELRADTPLAERNYRAQVAWAKDPELGVEAFR